MAALVSVASSTHTFSTKRKRKEIRLFLTFSFHTILNWHEYQQKCIKPTYPTETCSVLVQWFIKPHQAEGKCTHKMQRYWWLTGEHNETTEQRTVFIVIILPCPSQTLDKPSLRPRVKQDNKRCNVPKYNMNTSLTEGGGVQRVSLCCQSRSSSDPFYHWVMPTAVLRATRLC